MNLFWTITLISTVVPIVWWLTARIIRRVKHHRAVIRRIKEMGTRPDGY